MKLNGYAGGSKSAFLKKVGTHFRDEEIRIRCNVLKNNPRELAEQYGVSRQRISQIKNTQESVVSDPRHFWNWVIHNKRLKNDHRREWTAFVEHWREREARPAPTG